MWPLPSDPCRGSWWLVLGNRYPSGSGSCSYLPGKVSARLPGSYLMAFNNHPHLKGQREEGLCEAFLLPVRLRCLRSIIP